jgi:hypothetical protein
MWFSRLEDLSNRSGNEYDDEEVHVAGQPASHDGAEAVHPLAKCPGGDAGLGGETSCSKEAPLCLEEETRCTEEEPLVLEVAARVLEDGTRVLLTAVLRHAARSARTLPVTCDTAMDGV